MPITAALAIQTRYEQAMGRPLKPPPEGFAARVRRVADAQGAVVDDPAPLCAWLERMVEWNARMDLTAARDLDELVDLMTADALLLSKHVAPNAHVVDVGCGAGAPGLALALLRRDLRVTLVEPKAKRVAFMRTVLAEQARLDVRLERATGEEVAGRVAGMFDEAISRATLAPPEWLALGRRLAPRVWVLLARESAPAPEAEVIEYTWPLTHASRRAARYG